MPEYVSHQRAQRYFIILPCLLVGYGHQNYTWDICRRYSIGSVPFWSNRYGLLQRSDKEGLTPTIFTYLTHPLFPFTHLIQETDNYQLLTLRPL
jgi:hypothetical protein